MSASPIARYEGEACTPAEAAHARAAARLAGVVLDRLTLGRHNAYITELRADVVREIINELRAMRRRAA